MARLKGSAFISLLALLPSLAGVPTYVSLDLFIDHIALLSSFGGLNIFLICILYVIQLETWVDMFMLITTLSSSTMDSLLWWEWQLIIDNIGMKRIVEKFQNDPVSFIPHNAVFFNLTETEELACRWPTNIKSKSIHIAKHPFITYSYIYPHIFLKQLFDFYRNYRNYACVNKNAHPWFHISPLPWTQHWKSYPFIARQSPSRIHDQYGKHDDFKPVLKCKRCKMYSWS